MEDESFNLKYEELLEIVGNKHPEVYDFADTLIQGDIPTADAILKEIFDSLNVDGAAVEDLGRLLHRICFDQGYAIVCNHAEHTILKALLR